jgi:predicted nucleic acid-binding protein
MRNIVVCDTCALIQLRKGGILHCLNELFDKVCIPTAVEMECKDPETMAAVRTLGLKVCSVNRVLSIGMGRGEREAISLVNELGPHAVLITDDEKAIKKARNLGLAVFETRYIIILAKYAGLIPSAKVVLDRMREKGEGIEDKVYLRTLQETGETVG